MQHPPRAEELKERQPRSGSYCLIVRAYNEPPLLIPLLQIRHKKCLPNGLDFARNWPRRRKGFLVTAQACDQVLGDIPRVLAQRQPAAPAFYFHSRVTTFQQLDEDSNRAANGLIAAGVRPGGRIVVIAKDSDHLYTFLFGSAKACAISVCVNWRLSRAEIAFTLSDSTPALIVVDEETLPKLLECSRQTPLPCPVLLFSGRHADWPVWTEWLPMQSATDPGLPADPDDVCVHLYTSGTTGTPKAAQIAHRSFFAIVKALRQAGDPWLDLGPHDTTLYTLPTFHIGGLWWAMVCLNAGVPGVILESFHPGQVIRHIAEYRVSKFCMVPAMIRMVLMDPDSRSADFSSIQCLVYGGSPISSSLLEEARQTFDCDFAQFYGLTETGNTAVFLRPEDHRPLSQARARSAGRPYPGVELQCVDAEGKSVPMGEPGEIWIRSPANMVGYWNQPQATAETLVDGWIRTGDVGYLDAEGYVTICDRLKDMVIVGGEKVFSPEVEVVLRQHPAVADVAVIGIPHEFWGEEVLAIVVLKSDVTTTDRELIQFCRSPLARIKCPTKVEFRTELPRTPSGKVRKGLLRQAYWQAHTRKVN